MISKAYEVVAIKIMPEFPNSPGKCMAFTFNWGVLGSRMNWGSVSVGSWPVIAMCVRLAEKELMAQFTLVFRQMKGPLH